MEHAISDTCPGALSGTGLQLFLALLQGLAASRCTFKTEYPADYGPRLVDGDEFDFVVVGAGSAGSVLANRLSELSGWKVLVLEAGTYPSVNTEIPVLFTTTFQTDEDWNYRTEPSGTCCMSLRDKKCAYPRGKVLGGSSSINAMMYVRSTPENHDDWVAAGNHLWDYETALKHYRNVEERLNTTKFVSSTSLKTAIIRAYDELGFKEQTADNRIGYGHVHLTVGQDGTRTNTAKAFLPPTKDRVNLYLALNAHVTQVLLDENNAATGVEILIGSRRLRVKSRKEVIISAGSINTPTILMRSGVGPAEHLKQLGIPLRHDLRVGENLQDHVVFLELFFNIESSLVPPISETDHLDAIYNFFVHRKGPLANPDLFNFHFTMNTKNNSQYPDLEIHHMPVPRNNPQQVAGIYSSFNYPPELVQLHVENNAKSSGVILMPKALTTKSKGKVLLRSSDPFDEPLIYPNFFTDEADVELLLNAVKFIKNMMSTDALSHARPKLVSFPVPSCRAFEFDSDPYWRCAIRNLATHLHHPVGTCKMGPRSDPAAVVDPTLKVHGVRGLRVVDASVIPKIPSCNTNAPVMMIADKAAEIIKSEWISTHTEL